MCGNLIYQLLQSVVNYVQKNLDELAQLLNLQTIFYLDRKMKTKSNEEISTRKIWAMSSTEWLEFFFHLYVVAP